MKSVGDGCRDVIWILPAHRCFYWKPFVSVTGASNQKVLLWGDFPTEAVAVPLPVTGQDRAGSVRAAGDLRYLNDPHSNLHETKNCLYWDCTTCERQIELEFDNCKDIVLLKEIRVTFFFCELRLEWGHRTITVQRLAGTQDKDGESVKKSKIKYINNVISKTNSCTSKKAHISQDWNESKISVRMSV